MQALRLSKHEPLKKGPTVVRVAGPSEPIDGPLDYDAVVCGGTLGLMVGAALAVRGHKASACGTNFLHGRAGEGVWRVFAFGRMVGVRRRHVRTSLCCVSRAISASLLWRC
jgi:hypothetical protein